MLIQKIPEINAQILIIKSIRFCPNISTKFLTNNQLNRTANTVASTNTKMFNNKKVTAISVRRFVMIELKFYA